MTSPTSSLAPLHTGEPKHVATRNAYGEALLELGKTNPDVVVLDADLSGSTKTKAFGQAHPERFFNIGVAEANMVGTAAGMAAMGHTVFASSFAMFAAGKAWEQIRQSVCVPELSVKICATHAGLTVGEDGKSHQMLEDIALMRVLPNMRVIVPADGIEANLAVKAAAATPGPFYVRLSRASTPIVLGEDYEFTLGKASLLREGSDLAIIACGVEVAEALAAAELLAADGVAARVINMATIDPIDEEIVAAAARECGAILTAEEHQIRGGLGEAVAGAVARTHPCRVAMAGMDNAFGQSGTASQLLAHYELDAAGLAARARRLLANKS
ncbi:MAG: transketolase family protein [Planctomycetota bacterium]|nr:transketolase family protein [Planctomycetota bacterium]